MQMTAFIPVIDDTTMLYDFAFYKMSVSQVNGTYSLCDSLTVPNGQVLYQWAPGVGPETLPAGGGIAVDPGDFQLKVHYIDPTANGLSDTSGVGVCVCPE